MNAGSGPAAGSSCCGRESRYRATTIRAATFTTTSSKLQWLLAKSAKRSIPLPSASSKNLFSARRCSSLPRGRGSVTRTLAAPYLNAHQPRLDARKNVVGLEDFTTAEDGQTPVTGLT